MNAYTQNFQRSSQEKSRLFLVSVSLRFVSGAFIESVFLGANPSSQTVPEHKPRFSPFPCGIRLYLLFDGLT